MQFLSKNEITNIILVQNKNEQQNSISAYKTYPRITIEFNQTNSCINSIFKNSSKNANTKLTSVCYE